MTGWLAMFALAGLFDLMMDMEENTRSSFRLQQMILEELVEEDVELVILPSSPSPAFAGEGWVRVFFPLSNWSQVESSQDPHPDPLPRKREREVIAPAERAPEGLRRLEAVLAAYFSYLERWVFPGGCFFASLLAEMDATAGPVHDKVVEIERQWVRDFEGYVTAAQKRGELRADEATIERAREALRQAGVPCASLRPTNDGEPFLQMGQRLVEVLPHAVEEAELVHDPERSALTTRAVVREHRGVALGPLAELVAGRCTGVEKKSHDLRCPAPGERRAAVVILAVRIRAGRKQPSRHTDGRAMLREIRDALYRLSYPASTGVKREPVLVIVTTHSPYLLDLFREHPEEIIIAHKAGQEAHFERLADRKDLPELLKEGTLGDMWYAGILGGVPDESR